MIKDVTRLDVMNAIASMDLPVEVPLHDCSICRATTKYVITDHGIWFDGNCNCTSWSAQQPRHYDDIMGMINMQSKDKNKIELATKFNITLTEE